MTLSAAHQCPDCGARLSAEPWAVGLCLTCLLDLGLSAGPDAPDTAEAPADLPTLTAPVAPLLPGQILGNRYRIRSLLGTGGMGEVFRAFDVKLRVDVALKALRPALLASERALSGLREEVRAAREVVSPNVCRVFDLIELDGRELVSMEFVDGVTLAELLRERSPLPLQEAREIASQFLAGLDAIHAAGLVHRDIKPENLMLTRAGRVVIMDFGIARAEAPLAGGTISGTPVYMAPEQSRGETVDARADVFSAGVVLAEMVFPAGVRTPRDREAVWRGVHGEPHDVGETPWAAVLRKAVAGHREHRYATAAALARALEEVTLRTRGDELRRPYPGLASFTEQDADYFVGRELEIEEMWKKLRRPHLLALIGPSGAGKSSFLRAGLAHTALPGWRVVIASPGDRPFAALAQALAPELSGDVEAVARLIDFEQPDVAVEVMARWRRRHEHALLILDQFEELFTQSPVDVQERFAQLLARLALDADIHVLLSLRDDFLFHCHRFESLAPVFSALTAIGPPTGAALRRALVQPALKCGYRFEDETVIEEMLAQVTGERGALPLVAFAMSRLWDRRDRERGLLTRAAYDEIGGVGGALAQHAEATLDRIGQDRVPIVRELFRNLVTAQGTRATLDRDELLSVFAEGGDAAGATGSLRQQAAEVLDSLVDARLLTSYELPSADGGSSGRRRVEIVHESLLTAWPRLVRWQTQDQDGAQLRDQLRQAARLWEERGKPEDLLWTGTSFREYELWRERYSGSLTAIEDNFTRAMTARAQRRRRHRRAAIAALVLAAIGVAAAMGVLWRRSEGARAQAVAAARHAEAQQLFALGQLDLERHPGAALAYAIASLERNDSPQARLFALQALWRGPIPFVLARAGEGHGLAALSFSSDNSWLAAVDQTTGAVRLWRHDGSAVQEIPPSGAPGNFAWGDFSADNQSFVLTVSDSIRIFELPAVREVRRIPGKFRWGLVRGRSVITGSFVEPTPDGRARRLLMSWPVPEGAPETTLGIWTTPPGAPGAFDIDPGGEWMLGIHGGHLYEVPLQALERAEPRRVLRRSDPINGFVLSADGFRIFALESSGILRAWSRETGTPLPGPRLSLPPDRSFFHAGSSKDGRWLAVATGTDGARLWNLDGPVDVESLAVGAGARTLNVAIDSTSSWMALQDYRALRLWPLTGLHPDVLRGPQQAMRDVAFGPQARWIAAGGQMLAGVSIWPMHARLADRTSLQSGAAVFRLAVSPRGDRLAAGTVSGAWLVPLDGGPPERLPGFERLVVGVALDREGKRLAAGGGFGGELNAPGESVIRIWDLDTREVQVLDAGDGQAISGVEFKSDGHLLSTGLAGLREWDLKTGKWSLLMPGIARAALSPDGRHVAGIRGRLRSPGGGEGTLVVYDLREKRSWDLPTHGTGVMSLAWHPSDGRVVTGSRDGIVRVGGMRGDEPHLLIGHDASIWSVAVEPGGQRIASTGDWHGAPVEGTRGTAAAHAPLDRSARTPALAHQLSHRRRRRLAERLPARLRAVHGVEPEAARLVGRDKGQGIRDKDSEIGFFGCRSLGDTP